MNRRAIEIIVASVVLLGLVLLVLFLLTRGDKPPAPAPTPEPQVTSGMPEVNPEDVPPPAVVSAQTVARVFVERFGSYSSESDFANVEDVIALATPSFAIELENVLAAERRASVTGGAYYGISTFVISSKVQSESETATTLFITTQRRESVGSPGNTTTRYQDIEVSLEKVDENWLIADYTWK